MIMKKLCILWLLSVSIWAAESLDVSQSIVPAQAFLGDELEYSLTIKHDPLISIVFDGFPEGKWGPFVVRESSIKSVGTEGQETQLVVSAKVSAYDLGVQVWPTRNVVYQVGESTATFNLTSLTVMVERLSKEGQKGFRGLKPPMALSLNKTSIALIVLTLLLCVGGGGYGLLYWRRRARGGDVKDVGPVDHRSPDQKALDDLNALIQGPLYAEQQYTEYYFRLTEILKVYFSKYIQSHMLDMTSTEAIRSLGGQVDDGSLALVRKVFQFADFVKFARYIPTPAEHQSINAQALDIIERTKARFHTSGGDA